MGFVCRHGTHTGRLLAQRGPRPFQARRVVADTDLYVEINFSANDCVRKIEQVMAKYGYDRAELEVFTEDN